MKNRSTGLTFPNEPASMLTFCLSPLALSFFLSQRHCIATRWIHCRLIQINMQINFHQFGILLPPLLRRTHSITKHSSWQWQRSQTPAQIQLMITIKLSGSVWKKKDGLTGGERRRKKGRKDKKTHHSMEKYHRCLISPFGSNLSNCLQSLGWDFRGATVLISLTRAPFVPHQSLSLIKGLSRWKSGVTKTLCQI